MSAPEVEQVQEVEDTTEEVPAGPMVLSNQNSLFDKDAFKKSAQHSNATHFLICIQCFEYEIWSL